MLLVVLLALILLNEFARRTKVGGCIMFFGVPAALNGIVEGGSANADPTAMTVVSAAALILNAVALGYIIYTSKKRHINPYRTDVFVNQKYYKDAMARADVQ